MIYFVGIFVQIQYILPHEEHGSWEDWNIPVGNIDDLFMVWSQNFLDKMGDADAEIPCPIWTTKIPKAAQPNLNYIGKMYIMFVMQYALFALYSSNDVMIKWFMTGDLVTYELFT